MLKIGFLNNLPKTPAWSCKCKTLFAKFICNAANYDGGLFVTTAGLLGKYSVGGGQTIGQWVKNNHRDFKPKRILDIGCCMGHNTLPIAKLFPDAEVVGIDTGPKMLFGDGSFDWIQTTMFLHDTGGKSIYNIIKEIFRCLAFGG